MNGPQLAEHVGITYRQVDYWTRQGWLTGEDAALVRSA